VMCSAEWDAVRVLQNMFVAHVAWPHGVVRSKVG
jgi:hypothetical protein